MGLEEVGVLVRTLCNVCMCSSVPYPLQHVCMHANCVVECHWLRTHHILVLQNVSRCDQKIILCCKRAARSHLYPNNKVSNEKQHVSWIYILTCDNHTNNLQLVIYTQVFNDVQLAHSQIVQYITQYWIRRFKLNVHWCYQVCLQLYTCHVQLCNHFQYFARL